VHPIKKIARIYVAVEAVTAQSSRGEFLVATRFSVTIFWATLDRSYDEFLGTNIWCRCSQPLMTATACPFGFAGSMSQCMSSLCNCYKHKKNLSVVQKFFLVDWKAQQSYLTIVTEPSSLPCIIPESSYIYYCLTIPCRYYQDNLLVAPYFLVICFRGNLSCKFFLHL